MYNIVTGEEILTEGNMLTEERFYAKFFADRNTFHKAINQYIAQHKILGNVAVPIPAPRDASEVLVQVYGPVEENILEEERVDGYKK